MGHDVGRFCQFSGLIGKPGLWRFRSYSYSRGAESADAHGFAARAHFSDGRGVEGRVPRRWGNEIGYTVLLYIQDLAVQQWINRLWVLVVLESGVCDAGYVGSGLFCEEGRLGGCGR
jgi:hypothetical protein